MSSQDHSGDPGRGPISPEDREAMRRRAADIGRRLDEVKGAQSPPASGAAPGSSLGYAFRFTFELLAGLLVGGGVGWWLDRQFGIAPLLMIVLAMLGFVGSLVNVIRAAQRDKATREASLRPAPSVKDDDDDR